MSMEQHHFQPEEASASREASAFVSTPTSRTEEESSVAETQDESTTSAETAPLMTLLQQEARNRRNEELATFAWSGGFLVAMLWLATRPISDAQAWMTNLKLCCALIIALGIGMTVQIARRSYRRQRSLTRALAQNHDVSQVGPLIQALRVQNTSVRNLAKNALIPLLPTVQASDSTQFGSSERDILLRLLSISPHDLGYRDLTELFSRSAYRREVDLRLAILKAFEQVGGSREQAAVERLARGLPPLQSAVPVPPELQQAAKDCLPYLQLRATEQRAREQLLRASSAHNLSDDVLLRPATTRPEARPEQLLRASEPIS